MKSVVMRSVVVVSEYRNVARVKDRRHLSSFISWPDPKTSESGGDPPPSPSPQNPPDAENPDPATLREQWKYAIGLYSRWYSHAWGTTILAGLSFFAIGWFVKGENPLNREPSPVHEDPALASQSVFNMENYQKETLEFSNMTSLSCVLECFFIA